MNTVHVRFGARSYDIIIGSGLLEDAGGYLRDRVQAKRVIIVTDTGVAEHYLRNLTASLHRADIRYEEILLPPGEQTKSFMRLERLMTQLLDVAPDRNIILIALGGGVIGDITGFAASILLRGVDFIQIPTTLLAQVDSSVGGKTGINTPHGKNLLGSFHQPRLVIADTGTLATLPRRELLSGYAEVVKYGVINDAPFFRWLEEHGIDALDGDTASLSHMITKSCEAKATIVEQDERESGIRAILNFGHTLGHALEAEMGFSETLLHGEAVAIGMVLALELSVRREICSRQEVARVENHLQKAGLKTRASKVSPIWNIQQLIEHCHHDKKAYQGNLTFILAEKIGKTIISHDINDDELQALLAEAL